MGLGSLITGYLFNEIGSSETYLVMSILALVVCCIQTFTIKIMTRASKTQENNDINSIKWNNILRGRHTHILCSLCDSVILTKHWEFYVHNNLFYSVIFNIRKKYYYRSHNTHYCLLWYGPRTTTNIIILYTIFQTAYCIGNLRLKIYTIYYYLIYKLWFVIQLYFYSIS